MCRHSPCAFALFGVILAHLGRFKEAYEYGHVALLSEQQHETRELTSATFLVAYTFLHHLQQPVLSSLKPLEEGYNIGMKYGILNVAGRCIAMKACIGIHGNVELQHLESEIRRYFKVLRTYKLEGCLPLLLPAFQLVLNLSGQSEAPTVLSGEAMNDDLFDEEHAKLKSLAPRVILQNCRMMLLVFLDELDLAGIELGKPRLRARGTPFFRCCDYVYCALAHLGLARETDNKRKSRVHRRAARKYRKELEKFVRCGSVNCVPFVQLLNAEDMSLGGRKDDDRVLQLYRQAVDSAESCGFRLFKGLALERAGQHLLGLGDRYLAREFITNAWAEFADHGALTKLSQMERKYEGACSFKRTVVPTPAEKSQRKYIPNTPFE